MTYVEAQLHLCPPGRGRAPRIQKDDDCSWQGSEEGSGRNTHWCIQSSGDARW